MTDPYDLREQIMAIYDLPEELRIRWRAFWRGEPVEVASFTCPRCGLTSYHPDDVREGYCGACHDWTCAVHQQSRHG